MAENRPRLRRSTAPNGPSRISDPRRYREYVVQVFRLNTDTFLAIFYDYLQITESGSGPLLLPSPRRGDLPETTSEKKVTFMVDEAWPKPNRPETYRKKRGSKK